MFLEVGGGAKSLDLTGLGNYLSFIVTAHPLAIYFVICTVGSLQRTSMYASGRRRLDSSYLIQAVSSYRALKSLEGVSSYVSSL